NAYAYDWRTFITASYSQGPWSATLRWRHLPSIASQAAGTPGNTDRDTKPYDNFNLSGRYNLSETINLRFGIDNLLDEQPERAFANDLNSATGVTNTNFYDILGRRYYVGANVTF